MRLIHSIIALQEQYMLPCLSKKLFGFECLGCGLQRSVVLIFNGHFINAFYMYPAVYSLILLFIAIVLNFFIKFRYSNRIINILAIITVVTIIISYIIKITN